MRAEGRRELTTAKCCNAEKWTTVKGFWDGTCKEHVKSGCVVVVEGVDKGKWITISSIAVPLKVGTPMAAEVVGLCLLTSILDLVFDKK